MGVSTDGQICFGIKFNDDGQKFPWDECDGIDYWWIDEILQYKPLYPEERVWATLPNGEWKMLLDENERDKYYSHRREFKEKYPLPVTTINYCSDDCPAYIIAIPESRKIAHRGYPEKIDINLTFTFPDIQAWAKRLEDFCDEYLPGWRDQMEWLDGPAAEGPHWWLSSYWG